MPGFQITETGISELTLEECAKRLWNCDETAFATDVASKKTLARRSAENVGESGREYITVLGCGLASGVYLPPYTV